MKFSKSTSLKSLGFAAALSCATISMTACSGENGVDGKDGKDAAEVNVDSLASVLREEITGTLWDTLYAKPYVDTVYQILFDNAFADSWMDSVREALIDSLKQADYDSLYANLYDSVYADIYSKNVIRNLDAFTWTLAPNINAAFAPQYPLMYKDYTIDGEAISYPVSVKVRNSCDPDREACRWNKILLKAWIPGITDTATVTDNLNYGKDITLAPTFKYDSKALAAISAPEKTQIQLRAYALENDREILFFSKSEAVTIHPVEVFGAEGNIQNRNWWHSAWVTPNMDSISTIHKEMEALLPGGQVKAYQLYAGDEDMITSSARLVKAVYDVLAKKDIDYVSNTGAASLGQKIKYPIQVLREKQANCIEGVDLFASILESLGMHTLIVLIPGHAFIGWYTDEEMTNYNFLETTAAWGGGADFMDAYKAGMDEFNEQVELGNFQNGTSEIVSLDKARAYGIMPNDVP